MEFNQHDFVWLYGHMWVHVLTCEKMLVIDDLAISLEGLCGEKVFLPQNKVEELCWIEDRVNNYLEY
jgi:hypothetical protein